MIIWQKIYGFASRRAVEILNSEKILWNKNDCVNSQTLIIQHRENAEIKQLIRIYYYLIIAW